jgi:hypothetical protein
VEVRAVEETANTIYLVLPPPTSLAVQQEGDELAAFPHGVFSLCRLVAVAVIDFPHTGQPQLVW